MTRSVSEVSRQMSSSIEKFVENLRKSRLLTDAQLKLLKKQLVGNPITASALADVLVEQSHLTDWQARQLLKGETGFVLDQYRLLGPIGRGGMGHVFRGKDTRTGDVVAVKVMARKLTSNQTLVSRFQREIRANAQLNSRNVVRSLDAGRVGKVDFMVMEYVNGDQIDRMATVLKRVPTGLACDIVRQAAEGLQHAHEHGMVHRDIKPANLMVDWTESGDGVVKLMDMGLVLLKEDDTKEETVTRAGQVMGTPDFMSPEQGWDTGTVDIRSDIYSLGCTLYRLLTGTVPFAGTNPLQVLSQRLQRDAPSVQTVCDDIPDDIAQIVSKMTLRDPNARYQQPAEVAAELASVSQPLTRKAMRKAARKATNDPNAIEDFGKGSDNEVDETDGTYRQFLKEVQEGSVVDLMLATETPEHPSVETLPVLNVERPSLRRNERPAVPRRGQKTAFMVMGAAAIALLAVMAFMFSRPTPKPIVPPPQTVAEVERPTVSIADSNPSTAKAGQPWQHQLVADISDPSAETKFQLTASAPPLMEISDTGLMKWNVPELQTPATYQVKVIINHLVGENVTQVGSTVVPVKVEFGFGESLFSDQVGRLQATPGQVLAASVAPEFGKADGLEIRYELAGRYPPQMTVNKETGAIAWTPATNEIGVHQITVLAFEESNPDVKVTRSLRVLVRPTRIEHVVPELPSQTAFAGELVQARLEFPNLNRRPRQLEFLLALANDAPQEATFDTASGLFRWKVPENAEGRVLIPFTLSYLTALDQTPVMLEGTRDMAINIAARIKTKQPQMPDSGEVEKALEDLQGTLGRQITQARNVADRAELASRLMEQAIDGRASPSDFALLNLIESELAQKARATDVLLRIVQIRQQRYGMNQREELKKLLGNIRRTGLNVRQQDLTIEWLLLLAEEYVQNKDFEITSLLLKSTAMLLGRTPSGPAKLLANDISQAQQMAEELERESSSEVSNVRLTELRRIVERWQFKPLLKPTGPTTFVQLSPEGSDPILTDNGRSRWALKPGFVGLKSDTVATYVGIVDDGIQNSSYVVRFEVLPESNCGHIMFGVAGINGDDFKAFGLALDASNPGRIQSLRPIANVGEVMAKPPLFTDQANLIELVVDRDQAIARINGVLVSQVSLPGVGAGRIGVIADLRGASPEVAIRSPRILVLPDAN